MIPEEYYTAKKLQPDAVKACLAGQPKETICINYQYINLNKFQMVQAESGTNSKGYGTERVAKTRLFNDPDLLQQLPALNGMAEMSPSQVYFPFISYNLSSHIIYFTVYIKGIVFFES